MKSTNLQKDDFIEVWKGKIDLEKRILRKCHPNTSVIIDVSYSFHEKDIAVFGKKHSGRDRFFVNIKDLNLN